MHIEHEIKTHLKLYIKDAKYERKLDHNKINHHLTIRNTTEKAVLSALNALSISYEISNRIHSGIYTGHKCFFKNQFVYICVRDIPKNHRIRRKLLTPDNLGLSGRTFTNSAIMKEFIINGLESINDAEVNEACISLIDHIDQASPFKQIEILNKERSIITSDFGEIVGAYKRSFDGSIIEYPAISNYPGVDYFADGIGISAKGFRGSPKMSVNELIHSIDHNNTIISNRLLIALINKDIFLALEIASDNCSELKYWSILLGGISESSVSKYIKHHTYKKYLNEIIQSQGNSKLGIPGKNYKIENWKRTANTPKKSALLFTLCTFLDRYFSKQNSKELSDLINTLFKNATTIVERFDYNTSTNTLDFIMEHIVQYNTWKIHYWANSNAPLNNWPGIQGENIGTNK